MAWLIKSDAFIRTWYVCNESLNIGLDGSVLSESSRVSASNINLPGISHLGHLPSPFHSFIQSFQTVDSSGGDEQCTTHRPTLLRSNGSSGGMQNGVSFKSCSSWSALSNSGTWKTLYTINRL